MGGNTLGLTRVALTKRAVLSRTTNFFLSLNLQRFFCAVIYFEFVYSTT
jgi:hypothetical protein